jgi:hypothetical protein
VLLILTLCCCCRRLLIFRLGRVVVVVVGGDAVVFIIIVVGIVILLYEFLSLSLSLSPFSTNMKTNLILFTAREKIVLVVGCYLYYL